MSWPTIKRGQVWVGTNTQPVKVSNIQTTKDGESVSVDSSDGVVPGATVVSWYSLALPAKLCVNMYNDTPLPGFISWIEDTQARLIGGDDA